MALQRRYSSVGPAVSHRRLLHADFDCVKLIESEVLHHAGAPDKKQQVWYKFEFKMHEFARTGPPEEMGKNYDNKDLHESEIKTITEQVMRRHSELGQLVKYLKETLPKQAVVDGKVALHANVPTAPKKDLFKSGKGLNKSKTEWPGPMSKSALPQAGTENTKYLEYKINNPTEQELKLWFVSLCQVSGAQDTEGFQHFLKSDDHRIIEFGSDGGGSCCTIV